MRLLALIIAITGLLYAPVVHLGFVSDDNGLIVNAATGVANHTVLSVFHQDLWHFQDSQSGYYRPLMMLSLILDSALFGDWAGGYHLHSLVWHLVVVFLLGRLIGSVFDPTRGALAAAVYAVHPLVTESVCFISARNDSMALALGLGAVLLAAPRAASPIRLAMATVCASASLLAKENGLIVLTLLPLMDWAERKLDHGWHRYAALATGALAAMFIRELVGPGLHHAPPLDAIDLVSESKLTVIGTMIAKTAWPAPLTDSLHVAYLHPVWTPALAAVGMFVLYAVKFGGRWAQAGLLFFAAALVPGVIAVASRFLIGERYLAMPLIGLIIAFTAVCPTSKRLPWALALMIPWATLSSDRIRDWTSDLTLAESAHLADPTPYTAAWYGHELASVQRVAEALPLLKEATAGTPPTCAFAAEWIHGERVVNGPKAAIQAAHTVWERRCANGPGVRGAWAYALLADGNLKDADALLTPRPAQCDASLSVALVTVHALFGEDDAAERCAQQSGIPSEILWAEVAVLTERSAEWTDR